MPGIGARTAPSARLELPPVVVGRSHPRARLEAHVDRNLALARTLRGQSITSRLEA